MFALKKRPTSSDDLPIYGRGFWVRKTRWKRKAGNLEVSGGFPYFCGAIAGWFISWKIRRKLDELHVYLHRQGAVGYYHRPQGFSLRSGSGIHWEYVGVYKMRSWEFVG